MLKALFNRSGSEIKMTGERRPDLERGVASIPSMMGGCWSQDVHRFELWLGFKEGVGRVNDVHIVLVQTLEKEQGTINNNKNRHQ